MVDAAVLQSYYDALSALFDIHYSTDAEGGAYMLGNYRPPCGGEVGLEIYLPVVDGRVAMPIVRAFANWLSPFRSSQNQNWADWHRYPDSRICYGLAEEWYRIIDNVFAKNKFSVEVLACKLKHDIDTWLNYHRLAYVYGYDDWRKEWVAHPHGSVKCDFMV